MRCGFWRFKIALFATISIFCFASHARADEKFVLDDKQLNWPTTTAKHFVLLPDRSTIESAERIRVDSKAVVFIPRGAEAIEIEPQVYGVKPLAREVTKHYTYDFIIYAGWLAAFGVVLANK